MVIRLLRWQLIAASGVPDIHGLESVRRRLPPASHLCKEIIRNASSRLLHYFLGDSISILILQLLILDRLIKHVLGEPLRKCFDSYLLGKGLQPLEVVLLLQHLCQEEVMIVLLREVLYL